MRSSALPRTLSVALHALGRTARRWAALALFTLICILLVAAHLGCQDPEARYRMLSTFFDGVPPPEGYEGPLPPKRRTAWNAVISGTGVDIDPTQTDGPDTVAVTFFYHKPYTNHICAPCHDQASGYTVYEDDAKTCKQCHAPLFDRGPDEWVHGPVIFNDCRLCHESHKSEHEGLLTKPQPELCYTCHDPEFNRTDPFHAGLTDRTCSRCHDPHHAGNRTLLIDSSTYKRRRVAVQVDSVHPAFAKDECDQCHLPERSNMLRDDVDKACLTCHTDEQQPAGDQPLHQAVVDGKCSSCHTPHKSPRPHLVRPRAEANCLPCHSLEKINTPDHPVVTRVECLMCHTGHSAKREHLLRDGIAQPPARPTDADANADADATEASR